ncbi:amidase signature enzyme [Rhodofomes roseus]|uniref:amidase n=1 Tax=Rhodofomes roseus TaxID=34475 RepID=A0ABQ8K3E5_9APHY|nr:amidase signature enzyme [Rhodofomes roseus]KAH9831152.1 amidase signature enzyme [Rhodofomes roseus]
MMFSYLAHRRACYAKQQERRDRIYSLSPVYGTPLSAADKDILSKPIAGIVSGVQSGSLQPSDILLAYGKAALKAHAATNCLTEVLLPEAEEWAKNCNTKGPLAGMPVSLKDENSVAGFDASVGYSAWVGKKMQRDSALVKVLRAAGAVPYVKTNVPITMLSFECANEVFGTTTNPHGKDFAPGGSSGGEAALLAFGGSRVGVGSDVAGSVRIPSHYSGTYTIKASSYRFLKTGNAHTSIPGEEGVPVSFSPMTRTLEDLETFWKAIMSMKPWDYDHAVLPIPWRKIDLSSQKGIRWGVMWDDGVAAPSPACHRALHTVAKALEAHGHQVIPVSPPSPYEGLKIAAQLLMADGCKLCIEPIRTGEFNDPGVREALGMFRAPRIIKKLYAWYLRYIKRDPLYAGLVEAWSEKTVPEYLALVSQREAYRERWFEFMNEQGLDFILTVPNSLPAVPHGGMKEGWKACGYTFLWNLLDYTGGILPVTHVDRARDALGASKARNAIEAGQNRMYDADRMHGLPVGVQVVGRRLQEEKVLEAMKIIHKLLSEEGKPYIPLSIPE